MKPNKPKSATTDLATKYAKKHDSDVIAFNGYTFQDFSDQFLDLVHARKRKTNVLFVLVSPGGTADAAYRIARCLQQSYENFTVLVPGWCKSAGTLCVLGAHEIVMMECAELGPLDVQLPKRDELGEMSSGLVLVEALRAMKQQAFQMYEEYMLQIKDKSDGLVSFKMATEIAAQMAIGLNEPIFGQVEPMQVGETFRSMRIARAYGSRLLVESKNSRPRTLELLVDSYPDHGFVIDRREAEKLFYRVREPNSEEVKLVKSLGDSFKYPPQKPTDTKTIYLNDERAKDETANRRERGQGAKGKRAAKRTDARGHPGRAVEKRGVTPAQPGQERIRLLPNTQAK